MPKLNKQTISRLFRRILPFLALSTVMSLTIYAAVHQATRQAANDPQVQISESLVEQIEGGFDPANLFSGQGQTDMKKNLTPFAAAYDENFKVVGSSATLNGTTPTPPHGVFEYAKSKGENRITLEPEPGTRIAAVIRHYKFSDKDGYMLVGRSLREVEKIQRTVLKLVVLGWLASNVAVAGAFYLQSRLDRPQTSKPSRTKK